MKRPIEMVFLKEEEEEEYDDLLHLLGCNPPEKKRYFPTKKQRGCDIKDGFLRPVAFPIHQPPQITMTRSNWLCHAAEISLQELENEKKKKKNESEIAVHIYPDATEELNEKKRKTRVSSASHPHPLNDNSASCSAAAVEMKRPIEMVFLKEEEEEEYDLLRLLGCNPFKKKRSMPKTKKQRGCDIKDGFLRPVAFPIHEQPQVTMTRFNCLLDAAAIALQELLENEKKTKKESEIIALGIHPDATKELNEKKRKRKASSASHPLNYENKNKRRKVSASCSAAAVELPPEFKHRLMEMGGREEEVVLVIQKRLFQSDIDPDKGRLSIPSKQVANEFLTPQEKDSVLSGTRIENIPLIEPNCTYVTPVTLKKWDMSANCVYNLITGWNAVRKRNGLVEGDLVQLWAFRAHPSQDLCLLLVHHSLS